MSDDQAREWLVWSALHQAFWRPGGLGYTDDPAKAARYTRAEAKTICTEANRYSSRIEEAMVKASDLLR